MGTLLTKASPTLQSTQTWSHAHVGIVSRVQVLWVWKDCYQDISGYAVSVRRSVVLVGALQHTRAL